MKVMLRAAQLIGSAALALLVGWAAPLRAQVTNSDSVLLTLSEAQGLALSRNPQFLAQRQEQVIAEGRLRQARVFAFNPTLQFEAPGNSTEGAFGEYEANISQEVEWAGQRGLRIAAARSDVGRATFAVLDAARLTVSAVTEAYLATYSAERRAQVAREILGLTRQLVAATRTQAREGEISALEANLAEIEFGRAQARVLAEEREAVSARLELQRVTGFSPAQRVRLPTQPLPMSTAVDLAVDSMIATALQRRPDLAARAQEREQLDRLTRLARREAIPNLSVGALIQRSTAATAPGTADGSSGSPRIGLVVGLPLPLWNRNQGIVTERRAMTEQASFAQRATELQIRTEVTEAYRALTAAREEVRVFERDVVEPARSNQRLLEAAFRAGKIGLPTLLLLRNQLLDAELGYWNAWLAAQRARLRLDAATGTLLSDEHISSLRTQ